MCKTNNTGFSLIELIIVVAIIGVLAAIAIPNYNEHITKAKITEAVGTLSEARTRMEQYFQDNRQYTYNPGGGDVCPLTVAPFGPIASTKHFSFTCVSTATTYTVTANGIGNMTGFRFTINELNTRATPQTPANSGWSTNNACWVMSKGGSC